MGPSDLFESENKTDLLKPLQRRKRRSPIGRATKKARNRLSRVNWLVLVILVVGLIATAGVVGTALTVNANGQVQGSLRSMMRVLDSLNGKTGSELTMSDYTRLSASVRELNDTLYSAKQQIGFLRLLAPLNTQIDLNLRALDSVHDISLASASILTGLEPTIFFLVGNDSADDEAVIGQISSGERLVELLSIGRGQFVNAEWYLNRAQGNITASLNSPSLPPDLLLQFQALQSYQQQVSEISSVLTNAPELLDKALGLTEDQSYLVLSQNSDELRPSGGYLSTYGWFNVDNGRITNYDYSPTTETSPNPPSVEMPYEIPTWWIQYETPVYAAWDGSWSPDFRQTAERAKWYYDTGNNPQAPVFGVMAIDITGFESLLGALGDVYIPDYNQTVNSSNFRQIVYEIRLGGEANLQHKRFLASMYRQIFLKWQNIESPEDGSRVLGTLLQALQQNHIMMYFEDPQLQQAIEMLGWSGEQHPADTGDYLMVVDANLGNKSNHSIQRQIIYDALINMDGSVDSRVSINYQYLASVAENDPAVHPPDHGEIDYHNLLQIFLPPESAVTNTDGFDQNVNAGLLDNYNILSSILVVNYDTSKRLQVSYTSEGVIENLGPYQRYELVVEKQPGTLNQPLQVQISLPAGASIVSVSPEPDASYYLDQPILEFGSQLVTDQTVEIVYQLPG